ncbi:uncharacterized protein LOC128397145 [Panonychus citri]|uniref:uncharacterized protein LOC128397145 n=1 Tax=Panonychus citri TaxID=50023 RepID=UPI002307C7E6|nr:uncharacterized protein LOC128397145 [Panonychus citri]
MYQVTSLSIADKPYYTIICRYIEKDSQKKRKLVLPIRELKTSPIDVLSHFQAIGTKIRTKHATLLNSIDNNLLIKCLLVGYYHSTGSTESQSIKLADKLMKSEVRTNNRRVSFREPPEAIKYDDIDYDEDEDNNDNLKSKTKESVSPNIDEYDEDDDDFAF